jgi:hypothetical protein
VLNYNERQKLAQLAAKLKYGTAATDTTAKIANDLIEAFPTIQKDFDDYADKEASDRIIHGIFLYISDKLWLLAEDKIELNATHSSCSEALSDWCYGLNSSPTKLIDQSESIGGIIWLCGFASFLFNHESLYPDIDVIIKHLKGIS